MEHEDAGRRKRLDQAKKRTLVQTNAQAIAETLRQLRAAPDIHRRRWIWELIQNAADAARENRRNRIRVEVGTNRVIFRHDGAPFDDSELSHLIYHGSTKQDDESKKGKFGSGFITIHLISERVSIAGSLKDEDGALADFAFVLDRTGATASEIERHMERAWDECLDSLRPPTERKFSTSFACDFDEQSRPTVTAGLQELEYVAPFVLALIDELDEISVVTQAAEVSWQKSATERVDPLVIAEVVQSYSNGDRSRAFRIATIGDHANAVAVAVLLHQFGARWKVGMGADLPRLFYPLPLVGTEALALSFAIVADRFEPTAPRNGIWATSNVDSSPATARNWKLLNEVPTLFAKFVHGSEPMAWENLHALAAFRAVPPREWLDEKKFTSEVVLKLLEFLRSAASDAPKLVRSAKGRMVSFAQTSVPIGAAADALYQLATQLAPTAERLPEGSLVESLNEILAGWASILEQDVDDLREALTPSVLADHVSKACKSLVDLDGQLTATTSVPWLNDLLSTVPEGSLEALLKAYSVLPDQNGNLRPFNAIRLDGGVDNDLKDICRDLGDDIRSELLDPRVATRPKPLFEAIKGRICTNEECLERAMKKVTEYARTGNRNYASANARLLRWLLFKDRMDKVVGYPVFMVEGTRTLKAGDAVLVPTTLWAERARDFADIFPANRRVDDCYAPHLADVHWGALVSAALMLPSIFITEEITDIEAAHVEGAIDEERDHSPKQTLTVTQLAFLRGEEGVLAELRKSKTKARRFLDFLLRFVTKEDKGWLDGTPTQCDCGNEHRILPGWLASLKEYGWVPVGKSRGDKPNPANIAGLLDDSLKQFLLQDSESARFLLRLNIGLSDLLRIGVPEAKRFQLDQISAKIYDSGDRTIKSVEAVLKDPSLQEEVLRLESEKKIVQRNKQIGSLIEKLLREALEADGIKVVRRPVGSDFEMSSDFIENDREQIILLDSTILELKATSVDHVRMTLRQAQEASKDEHKPRYVLGVVPLVQQDMDADAVRANARFVRDIGALVHEKVLAAASLKNLEQTISRNLGDPVQIDIEESRIRLQIAEGLWKDALTFDEFVQELKQRSLRTAQAPARQ